MKDADDPFGFFQAAREHLASPERRAHDALLSRLEQDGPLRLDLVTRLRASLARSGGWWGFDPHHPCVSAVQGFLTANQSQLADLDLTDLDASDVVATVRDQIREDNP